MRPPARSIVLELTADNRAYQPGERAWAERASEHITCFLAQQPRFDELAALALLRSAHLVWENAPRAPRWSALIIHELFRRLAIEHACFPQPALVVAHFEILGAFVPWLRQHHLVSRFSCQRLLAELAQARWPLVESARDQLHARRRGAYRQGSWHEVLKTFGP